VVGVEAEAAVASSELLRARWKAVTFWKMSLKDCDLFRRSADDDDCSSEWYLRCFLFMMAVLEAGCSGFSSSAAGGVGGFSRPVVFLVEEMRENHESRLLLLLVEAGLGMVTTCGKETAMIGGKYDGSPGKAGREG
jgi:hypothetical protein